MEDVYIITSGTSKTCTLDPLPTSIVKQYLPKLRPYVTAVCNTYLQQSYLLYTASEETEKCRPGKVGLLLRTTDLKSDIYA